MSGQFPGSPARDRLDQTLVVSGPFKSRARARDAILRGCVKVNGATISKPGFRVGPTDSINVADEALHYVSRSALKLIAGLDHFGFDPTGRCALDIGASTGGFTQVLLERGAAKVTAIDVGQGQMHASLVADRRLRNIEGLNARELTVDLLGGEDIMAVVSDVSFISLKLALPPALQLSAPGCFCVLLVKPQFEAGREAIGKGGILRDPTLGGAISDAMSEWLDRQPGWHSLGHIASPIDGGDGNREFLLGGLKR